MYNIYFVIRKRKREKKNAYYTHAPSISFDNRSVFPIFYLTLNIEFGKNYHNE
jgi:hypothetical protein